MNTLNRHLKNKHYEIMNMFYDPKNDAIPVHKKSSKNNNYLSVIRSINMLKMISFSKIDYNNS